MISAYIRLYPKDLFNNKKLTGYAMVASLLVSWLSILFGSFVYYLTGMRASYHFVIDSNKLLAVITAVCAFLFFKNLNLNYYPIINNIAKSSFGVLLIHAHSDIMRQWLWRDVLNNVGAFHSNYFVIHAVASVAGVYVVCTLIDMVRIRIVETPFFRWYDKRTLRMMNGNMDTTK
jgi:hypothetical protein